MTITPTYHRAVAVLGLGNMGAALAHALVARFQC